MKKRQTVNIDRLVPCTQSTVSPETVVQPQPNANSIPIELDSQAIEEDSQIVEEESQFFQDSSESTFVTDSSLQRPTRKRKLPKHLEDYIV